MNEEKLEKELEVYRELAKQDKKVDLASLVINALHKHQPNMIDIKEKRWAFVVSFLIPGFGFFYAIKYLSSDKDDGKQVALMCFILALVAVFVAYQLIQLPVKEVPLNEGF